MVDSIGTSVSTPGAYIEVDLDNDDVFCDVSDSTMLGTYTVHYVVGLDQMNQSEIANAGYAAQTMTLDIVLPVCTSVLKTLTLLTQYEYQVGYDILRIGLDGDSGDCTYTATVTVTPVDPLAEAAPITTFPGTFSNTSVDPAYVNLFQTDSDPYIEVYTASTSIGT